MKITAEEVKKELEGINLDFGLCSGVLTDTIKESAAIQLKLVRMLRDNEYNFNPTSEEEALSRYQKLFNYDIAILTIKEGLLRAIFAASM